MAGSRSSCPVHRKLRQALVVLGAIMPKRAGHDTQSVVGMVSCVWAYVLTFAFARWEGLSLEDVGAALRWRGLLRFGVGFAIGLLLVGALSSFQVVAGDLRWVRTSDFRWGSLPIAFFAYLMLSTRKSWHFAAIRCVAYSGRLEFVLPSS